MKRQKKHLISVILFLEIHPNLDRECRLSQSDAFSQPETKLIALNGAVIKTYSTSKDNFTSPSFIFPFFAPFFCNILPLVTVI